MAATKRRPPPRLASSHRAGGARPPAKKPAEAPPETRCGNVAIVGRANVGKSTLVNAFIGFRLSITSPKPQTTRDRILGVATRGDAQLLFLDTPGLHRARNKLGTQMNAHAEEAARQADVIVYVTDADPSLGKDEALARDRETLDRVISAAGRAPILLAINKVDRLKEKAQLLPILEAYQAHHPFAAFVPISATRENGLDRLFDEIAQRLPQAPFLFPDDEITDRPERFLAAEQVREQVMRKTRDEVPYAIAVTIDAWEEPASRKGVTRIEATIHVDKDAQRKIVVGERGSRIKEIGIAARKAIEEVLGRRVHLGLFVKVEEGWAHDDRKLADLGYEPPR